MWTERENLDQIELRRVGRSNGRSVRELDLKRRQGPMREGGDEGREVDWMNSIGWQAIER